MTDFFGGLRAFQESSEKKKTEALWNGHSRFQSPAYVIGYKGEAETLVLLYLYQRATYINSNTENESVLEIRVKEETIADRCRLGRWAVSQAIRKLEADCRIRVSRTRDKITGEMQISIYLLLHSTTKEPLKTSPGDYGFCHANFERPYVTLPGESFDIMPQLGRSARAVYLTALAIGSARVCMSFGILRSDWKKESLLGRNAFNRGVRECKNKRLLTFKRGLLTLNDPETGRPSERVSSRVEHENPQWNFDLNDVDAATWRASVERLFKFPFTVDKITGWTHCKRGTYCPFCRKERKFRVNFTEAKYQCFNCERSGWLGKLVQKLLGTASMVKVKLFIREQMDAAKAA